MANNDAPDSFANSPIEEDAPITVPDSGDSGEGGKVKMIVQLVKKCLGVKDIAAMFVSFAVHSLSVNKSDQHRRLSLPASLMEPIPNLEYWHYLDRPDIFAALSCDSSNNVPALTQEAESTILMIPLNACWPC
jgi:hypothetical protein